MRSVIFSLIKTEEIIRSLSCKNPFCTIVSGLRFPKAREEQIPTAIREETTKRVNCHKNGNSPPILHRKRHTRRSFIRSFCVCLDGGAKGSRTPDLLNAIQTRYQLRYNPELLLYNNISIRLLSSVFARRIFIFT